MTTVTEEVRLEPRLVLRLARRAASLAQITDTLREEQRRLGLAIASSGLPTIGKQIKQTSSAVFAALREGRPGDAQALLEKHDSLLKTYEEKLLQIDTTAVSEYSIRWHAIAAEIVGLGRLLPSLPPEEE